MARISGIIAEPIVTIPASETAARISGIIAEPIVTIPASEAVARISGLVAEPIVTEEAEEMRTSFIFAEIFSEPPSRRDADRDPHGGGIQGSRVDVSVFSRT